MNGREKLALAKELRDLRTKIMSGGIGGREKLNLARRVRDVRQKILGAVADTSASLLQQLIEGKFSSLEPIPFIKQVRGIVESGAPLDDVKEPVAKYVKQRLA